MKMNSLLLPTTPPLTAHQAASNEREHWRLYTRNWTRSVLQLTALFAILAVGTLALYQSTRLPFDSTLWKSHNLSARDRMCSDLIRSQKLLGLPHAQVISLLGRPDEYHMGKWTMAYTVRSYSLDATALVIQFDKRKRVSNYKVQTFS